MSITVNVNGLSLVHKGSNGVATATIPDVCKTPAPPGPPVPVPYPNIARSSTLSGGTMDVKSDGGNSVAIKGSKFTTSNGNEAGSLGGIKSGVNMSEATWIMGSFDVKIEGKPSCRLSDKMFMNKQNTACMAGIVNPPVLGGLDKASLTELAKECNSHVNQEEKVCPDGPSGHLCTTLGTKKHKCCENAIKKYNEDNPQSKLQSEVGFDENFKALDKEAAAKGRQAADQAYNDFKSELMAGGVSETSAMKAARSHKIWIKKFREVAKARFIADVLEVDPCPPPPSRKARNVKNAYDFKFNCKEKGVMDSEQKRSYFKATGREVQVIHIDGRECK